MGFVKKYDLDEENNNQGLNCPKAYYKPTGLRVILKQEEVEVTVSVYADKEARDADLDVIDKEKHLFTFEDLDLEKNVLLKSAYKCLKKLDKFTDAEDI